MVKLSQDFLSAKAVREIRKGQTQAARARDLREAGDTGIFTNSLESAELFAKRIPLSMVLPTLACEQA